MEQSIAEQSERSQAEPGRTAGHGALQPRRAWGERLAARLRGTAKDPVAVAASLLIVVQLVVRWWFVRQSYYFQDDFGHLDLARRLGLSSDYLVRDYGGHLEVGQYVVFWAFSHVADHTFTVPTMSILMMQAAVSVALWLVLRKTFGGSPWLLVPFSVYLFTALGLSWSSWWAAAMQTLPLQLFGLLAFWGAVDHLRDGQRRGAVVSVGAQVAALVFWQKALFVLPVLIAFHVLVIARGTLKERVLSLRDAPRFWGAHAAVLALYLVLYTSLTESAVGTDSPVDVQRLLSDSVFRTLVPGLLGAPWNSEGATGTLYPTTSTPVALACLAVLAAVVALSVRVSGKVAYAGWFLAVGYVAADLILLALGRADFLLMLARDPRYVADALPVIAVGIAAAFRGAYGEATAAREPVRARALVVPVALSLALLVSGLTTQAAIAPTGRHAESKAYVQNLLRSLDENPDAVLLDAPVPVALSARTWLAHFLNSLGLEGRFDEPAPEILTADAEGNLRPVGIADGFENRAPDGGCVVGIGSEPSVVTGWTHPGTGIQLLRLQHASPSVATVTFTLGEHEWEALLPAGMGETYLVLPVTQGVLTAEREGWGDICVSAIEFGPADLE